MQYYFSEINFTTIYIYNAFNKINIVYYLHQNYINCVVV